jgi:hypothetical protein
VLVSDIVMRILGTPFSLHALKPTLASIARGMMLPIFQSRLPLVPLNSVQPLMFGRASFLTRKTLSSTAVTGAAVGGGFGTALVGGEVSAATGLAVTGVAATGLAVTGVAATGLAVTGLAVTGTGAGFEPKASVSWSSFSAGSAHVGDDKTKMMATAKCFMLDRLI